MLACQFFSNILRMNNFTQIVLNRTLNPLDLMTNDPAFIGICCFITVIVQIFGNGNLLVMMIYEKCGMDPQKRTVNNQLIFNLCISNLVQNLISCHLVTYRFLVSPLGKNKPYYTIIYNIHIGILTIESALINICVLRSQCCNNGNIHYCTQYGFFRSYSGRNDNFEMFVYFKMEQNGND